MRKDKGIRYVDASWTVQTAVKLGSLGFNSSEVATLCKFARKLDAIAVRQCNGYSDGRGNELRDRVILSGPRLELWADWTGETPEGSSVNLARAEWLDILAEKRTRENVTTIVDDHARRSKPALRMQPRFAGDPRGAVLLLFPRTWTGEECNRRTHEGVSIAAD